MLGNSYLFPQYSVLQKFIGVGTLQHGSLFSVVEYSSNYVSTLMNYGLIGLTLLLMGLLVLRRKFSSVNGIFFLGMIMFFAVDQQLFNWYFFYLLTGSILEMNRIEPVLGEV